MIMGRKHPIGRMTLAFVVVTGAGMLVGQWRGTDSPTLVGILTMLCLVAILLGEIVVRMERGPVPLVPCEQGIHGYRQATPNGMCPWCAWENAELRREAEADGGE